MNCLKSFKFLVSQLNIYRGAGKFCSRSCHYDFYRRNPEEHPLYKKVKEDIYGYRLVRLPNRGGVIREHRFLVEKKMGRKLLKNEHVHHINGIKSDNRLENLVVLTAHEHGIEHTDEKTMESLKKAQKISRERWARWAEEGRWSLSFSCCQACGTTKNKHQGNGLCRRCYLSEYQKKAKT